MNSNQWSPITVYTLFYYKKPDNPIPGDMFIEGNKEFVFTGTEWQEIGSIVNDNTLVTEESTPIIKYEKMIPQICTQCGAPIDNNKCNYCGTKYFSGR